MFRRNWVVMDATDDQGGLGGGGGVELDIGAAVDSLATDLGLTGEQPGSATPSPEADGQVDDGQPGNETDEQKAGREARERAAAAAPAKTTETAEQKAAREAADATRTVTPPKAWKREMHEHFGKLPPEVQAYVLEREEQAYQGLTQYTEAAKYGKSLRDVVAPYQPMLDSQGINDHAQAVKFLLNAHYQLSNSDEGRRAQFFAQLAKSYNINLEAASRHAGDEAPHRSAAEIELTERLNKVELVMTEGQQRQLAEARKQVVSKVEAFASDPAHPHFDEVADHIVLLLSDPRITLDQAYEQAVWANPVTRAKVQAEAQAQADRELRERADAEAAAALKARGTRVHGRVTDAASREPLGKMEDTMRATLAEIKGRED